MAPSTPPPPSKEVLAALTMASTSSVVISPTQISSRQRPSCAVRMVCGSPGMFSCPTGALLETGKRFICLHDYFRDIERGQPPALFEDAAVDHDGVDITATVPKSRRRVMSV